MLWTTSRILQVAQPPAATPHTDVAIILGAAVWRNQPSPVFAARIDYALELLNEGAVAYLIFTGGVGGGDKLAESTAAARYAIDRGAPADRLRCETTSATTWDNLRAAKVIMHQEAWQTATLVSDPLHIARAQQMADDLGMQPQPGPTPYTRYRTWNSQIPFLARELFFVYQYHFQGLFISPPATQPQVGNGICQLEQ